MDMGGDAKREARLAVLRELIDLMGREEADALSGKVAPEEVPEEVPPVPPEEEEDNELLRQKLSSLE